MPKSLAFLVVAAHDILDFPDVVFHHPQNAVPQSLRSGRTAGAGAQHLERKQPFLIIKGDELDIPAVVLHERPDSADQQLLDFPYDLRVSLLDACLVVLPA